MKSDDGAPIPVDRTIAPDGPASRQRGLRAGIRRAGAVAGLAFSAVLALVLASLLALALVRLGADWLDGTGIWGGDRPWLHPRQVTLRQVTLRELALRELALDVVRQILLAGLVVGVVRWRDGSDWRRTLALAPSESVSGPGLRPARFALILLVWPLVHIPWVTGSAAALGVPISRHGSLSPGLSAGSAAVWFAYVLILAPVAEELLIRGVLFARLRRLLSPAGTVGLTGLVFAFAHLTPAGIARPVSLLPLALTLGWVRWRGGRLGPCILLHAWSNLAMIAYLLWPASA